MNENIRADEPEMFGRLELDPQVYNFLKEFEPDPVMLFKWLARAKDRSDPVAINLARNAATLLLRISKSSLAGQDLSYTNLTSVSFYDADLRDSNLNNAMLKNAEMTSAKFYKRDIQSAKLDQTGISFYIVKTRQMPKEELRDFINYLDAKVDPGMNVKVRLFRGESRFRSDLFWEIMITVKDLLDAEAIREELSAALDTKVMIYFDEYETFALGGVISH